MVVMVMLMKMIGTVHDETKNSTSLNPKLQTALTAQTL